MAAQYALGVRILLCSFALQLTIMTTCAYTTLAAMNRRSVHLAISIALLASTSFAWAGGLVVKLSPQQQVVRSGETPRFVVEVRAGDTSVRIMKFATRGDLRDNYARIRVTRNGKEIDVPILISDPGPTSDSDYELLAPDQRVSFEHRGTPFLLAKLAPGNYSATVALQPDWKDNPVASNSVLFTVLPK